MTDPSTPPTPPPPGTHAGYTPKPRMPGGQYWLLITIGLLGLSLLAAWWASSMPPVFHGHCDSELPGLANTLSQLAVFGALVAGISAFAGVFCAWGWRWFFLALLPASPVVAFIALASVFYLGDPGCPGPLS